jgi:hypothetical protein
VHVHAELFGCQRREDLILAWERICNLKQWTTKHAKSLWWCRPNYRQWEPWNPIQEQLSCWPCLRQGRRHLRNRWCYLQDSEVVDHWSCLGYCLNLRKSPVIKYWKWKSQRFCHFPCRFRLMQTTKPLPCNLGQRFRQNLWHSMCSACLPQQNLNAYLHQGHYLGNTA